MRPIKTKTELALCIFIKFSDIKYENPCKDYRINPFIWIGGRSVQNKWGLRSVANLPKSEKIQ
jgi:hypothetical protein